MNQNPSTIIHYTTGDATAPAGPGPRMIVHICNDVGAWGAGFVLALSRRWSAPEREYRRWHARSTSTPVAGESERDGMPFVLGAVQFVEVEPDLAVANLIGQHRIRPDRNGTPPIRYEAVEAGLRTIATEAIRHGNATLHMPRIGCGLAGGRWPRIEPILHRTVCAAGVAVTVYDLPPPPRQ